MKKEISILLILVIMLAVSTGVSANPVFTVEELDGKTEPLLPKIIFDGGISMGRFSEGYLMNFREESYCVGRNVSHFTLPIKISDPFNSGNFIKAGNFYMSRDEIDGYWYDAKRNPTFVYLFDESLNELKKYRFKWHPAAIGYFNETYYCMLYANDPNVGLHYEVMKSTDFENWILTNEAVPMQNGEIIYAGDAISFNGTALISISYEESMNSKFYSTMGEWIVKKDDENNFYLSNDNVYFVKMKYPEDLNEFDTLTNCKFNLRCIYEYEDDLIIELIRVGGGINYSTIKEPEEYLLRLKKMVRLRVPKQEIYNELDRQKTAPYVKLNNKILGFTEPPVREDDRLLVPMRFLFEQMGEEVTWNGETETATVQSADGDYVSFSIDNAEANVNGQMKTMDVPARLVNDKTMVPLRFLSENLGCNVQWDEETKTAVITTEDYTPSPSPSLQPSQISQTTAAQQKNWFVKFIDFITFNKAA